MKLYADAPARRTRQVLADLLLVVWAATWVVVGNTVHDGTMALAGPGRQTEESASGMASGLRDAGARLDDIPLVGSDVASPFDRAAEASDSLAAAGAGTVRAVERLAFWLGLSTALVPILVVALLYLPRRWRFVRNATAGARFVDATEDLDLFALRALSRQPMHVLARISDDPAGAWRRRDPDVVHRLASLELRDAGLAPPRAATTTGRA
jgi:hypothetical protein